MGDNTINDSATSDIDTSSVRADGSVNLQARSDASIADLAFGGAGSVAGAGEGAAVALAGAGANSTNTITDTADAYIKACQDQGNTLGVVATNGNVTLAATDGSSITAKAGGGSVSLAVAPVGSGGAVSITAVVATNTITDHIDSYIDNSVVVAVAPGAQVDLKATTLPTSHISSFAIAASLSGSISLAGAGIAGGGGGATNTITNSIMAYIDLNAHVQADGLISISATDSAGIDSTVGSGALGFGAVGASIGISTQANTVTNTVSAYINAPVTVKHGGIQVTSGSTVTATGLAVATSVSAGAGAFGGSGAETDTTIGGMVEAYIGKSGMLTVPSSSDVLIKAASNQNAQANASGGAVSFGVVAAAIGVSMGTATIDGTTQAYMSGTLPAGNNLTVEADNASTGGTSIFALAGGISPTGFALAGAGTNGTVNISPTLNAFVDGAAGTGATPLGGDVTVRSIVDTSSNASAEGVSFSTGAAVAGSVAHDNVDPLVTTYLGGSSGVYTAGSIYLESLENYDTNGTMVQRRTTTDTASAQSGSGGILTGSGADSEVNGTPNLDTSVQLGTTVHAGANFVVLTLSYLNTDSEANSTQFGFIGGGEASANAISSGTLHSHVDGQVTAGTSLSDTYSNLAVAFHRAHSNAVGFLIALGAVGVYSHSTTAPVVDATMADGASALASGNAYNLAIVEDSANPTGEAKGIPAADNKPDGADDKPTLSIMFGTLTGAGASLTSHGSLANKTIVNMNVVPNLFPVVLLGSSAAAGNHPPSFEAPNASPNTASVASGSTTVLTVKAIDPENNPLTYSIIGGANASLFAIDPTTGLLTFETAPTYDPNTPANNTYVVEVAVGDQDGAYDFQLITITVTPASQLAAPLATDGVLGAGSPTDASTTAAADSPDPLSSRGAVYNRTVADTNTSNGPIDIINVVADASPNINIVLGAGSVLAAGSGDVVIDIESDNIARATGGGLGGIPPMVAVVNAQAIVGGTINISLAGTIEHQGSLTLQLHTINEAYATGAALSVGPVGGTGVTTDAEVTPTISTFVAPSSNINVTGDFTIRTISESTASAVSNGIAGGAGFAVGVSLANAEVAPTVSTYIGAGATITAGGGISVETFQNEDVNGKATGGGATATAEASAGSLIGTGTGAHATADNSPIVSAYVDKGAILNAGAQSPITVKALANNVATAQSQGIAVAGLLAVGATISDATANGSLSAHVDGAINQSGSVNVLAQGADTANASSNAVAGGILAGSGAVANSTVAPTVQAYTDGSQINSAGAVTVAANETPQSIADVTGVAAGGLAVGVSTSSATASPTVSGSVGGAGDTITSGSLTVDAATSTPTGGNSASSQAAGSSGGLIGVDATSSTATDNGTVASSIANQTNLSITSAVTVEANGNTNQSAMGTSNFGGIIAAGSNTATANSNAQTTATVGSGVAIGAGTAIGGLTDGTIYYVVPDPNNPGYFGLAASFNDATAAKTGPPPGIAGSAAATITLSQPAVQAGDHSLTPYNVIGASPIAFNPAAALSNNEINLGPNSGLFLGEAVVYRKSNGPSLTIAANGDDVNFAHSVAGSGGLVAGSAASANTTTGGGASASIADYSGSGNRTNLDVSGLTVSATHTAEFDSQTDTIQADALGFSGSWASNTDTSTVNAHIGSDATVTTQNLQVLATNNTMKDLVPSGQNNVSAGSGGVIQGNASQSQTSITNNTTADVGAGANLNVTGSVTNPGLFELYALNNLDGTDTVNLDTGGLIDGSNATSTIHADTNNATAEIGPNAVVTTVGDMNLDTRTTANLSVAPTVHTYGLASPGTIDAEATLGEADQVKVDAGATITAQGNLNLNAGGDMNGDLNDITMGSNAYELNASVIPAFELVSLSAINQNNTIDVAAGAVLKGASNANLTAQRFGNAVTNAFGTGKDWLTAAAGGLSSLFGGNGLSSDVHTGTGIVNTTTGVTVDGTIQLGINNQQSLTIQKDILQDPNDFSQTGGITFTQTTESLAADLGQELLRLQDLLAAYVGDTNADDAYQADINQVEAQMQQLGLGEMQTDAQGHLVFVPTTSGAVPFITVSPILAEAGTITVAGDDLLGGGQLLAPGDVSITITNNSPAFLRINQITIPQSSGGTVLFDGTSVSSTSAIGHVNESGTLPTFSQVQADNNSTPPAVTIANTFDASAPANANFEGAHFISPDIDLDGNISAPPTVLTVSSQGSVITNANIDVGKVVINAGANFIQSYTPGIDSIGGDPATLYQGVTNLTEATTATGLTPPLGTNLSVTAVNGGTAVQQAVYNAINSTGEGNILAANDVFISAQDLNIDGTIQSGAPVQAVTIDNVSGPLYNPNIPGWTGTESITDAINAAAAAYQRSQSGTLLAVPIVAGAGFEQPNVGPPNVFGSFVYDPTGSGWTFAGSAGITANGTNFTGTIATPGGGQVAFLQKQGSFSQIVDGWAAGTYQLSFQAVQRAGNNQDVQVLVDNTVVGIFQPTGNGYQNCQTAPFSVKAGSHTITFQGLDHATGDNTAFIDTVSVTQVTLDTVGDAGFEQPNVGPAGTFGSFAYNPTGTPWTFVSNSGIAANGSGFTSGNPAAPEGGQVAFLQEQGSFSQTVNGWAASTYQISFQAAQRAGNNQDFRVLIDNTLVGTFTPTGSSYLTYTTAAFPVSAGSHTITFKGLNTDGRDNTALIDAISVRLAATPVVGDAEFDQVSAGPGGNYSSFLPDPTGSAWTFASSAGVAANGSGYTDGTTTPGGGQVAFLQEHGSFSQTVDGWAAGTYQISFQAAQRVSNQQDFQVLIDNVVVGTFTPGSGSPAYQTYTTAPFSVEAGSHTITFQGLDAATGDNTALIDAISVSQAVPQSVRLVSAPSVGDAGFEHPDAGPNRFVLDPQNDSSWSFNNRAGVASNNSGYTNNGLPSAPEGVQVAVLQEMGSFTQTVNGWAAGSYQISFQAAQRVGDTQDFEVLIDNTVVGTFTPTGTGYHTHPTAPINVAAGSHTITYTGLDRAGATNDNTALIDAISVTLAGAPVVGDSGFEQPNAGPAGNSNSWVLDPPDPFWSFNNRAGVSANGSGYTNAGLPSAPEGVQVAVLQEVGSFSQTVQGWAAGTYQISFQAAQRVGNQQQQDFQVLIDSTVVGTFTPGTGYQTYTTAPFSVAAGSHTITFNGLDSAGATNDNTALIDAVSVSQVVAENDLTQYGVSTQDNKEFLLPEQVGDNIPVFYNAPLNQLELGQVQVQGGLAVLSGEILNTGTGNINVLDGVGQIQAVNDTTYTLVTGAMSTGQGTAGELKIIDTGKQDTSGHPLVTEYTRQNGQVFTNSYYANADGSVAKVVSAPAQYDGPNAGPRSASYQPAAARLVWEDGQDLSQTTTNLYSSSSWAGLINLGSADLISSTTTPAGTPKPLLAGEYIQSLPAVAPGTGSDSADYECSFQQIDRGGPPTTQSSSWSNSTWYGTTTYYEQTVTTTPKKNVNTNSIRADRPININFTGFDQGDPNQLVSVSTKGDLLVDGSILNDQGTTTLGSDNGAIVEENDSSAVGGQDITLTAAKGIGASDPLRLSMTSGATPTSPNPGTLNATSTSGDINLDDVSGSMTIGKITTAQATGDVTLTADESIYAADANSLVTGGAITLNAAFGSVGSLGTNGTANVPGGNALPITVDVGSAALNKLNVTARGDVFVRQASAGGDLRLNKISSAEGNVRVEVQSGDLIDANNISVPDTQNLAELEALWNRMLATQDTAQVSINATINAYEGDKTNDYNTYWQYRNQQAASQTAGGLVQGTTYYVVVDPADPTRIFLAPTQADAQAATGVFLTFDATAVDTTVSSLNGYDLQLTSWGDGSGVPTSGHNLVVAGIDNHGLLHIRIFDADGNEVTDTDETKLTATEAGAISALKQQIPGLLPPQHALTGAEKAQLISQVTSIIGQTLINLPGNTFTTGQTVVYHQGSGSIDGLTDGDTYYVWVDPSNPSRIGLATSPGDVQGATPKTIAFDMATGTGFVLADPHVIDLTASTNPGTARLYTNGGTSFVPFNTATAVAAAGDTIQLAPGHGLTTGTPVTYIVAFDPTYQVTFSGARLDAWKQYYTAQGTSQGLTGNALAGFVQSGIATLENQQTQEYDALNTTYGKFGDFYDPNFRYFANQTPLNASPNLTFGPSNVSGNAITLTGNPYTTGQAVVYHANGGSVGGLTDGDTYYVIVDPNNPAQISLAATYANATASTPVPIPLSSVTGTANTLSEIFQSFGPSSVDPTGFYIDLPQNVFNTGQAVIYHANGGSVAGLTDGNTYYVVVNSTDPTLIGLDASATDAVTAAPTLIALGAVAGTGNYLSEVDVESQRAAWSQSQLQNSIDLSIVDPRDFPSTVQTIPDANIEGKDVALVVMSGNIGSVLAPDVINLPLTAALPQNLALDLAAAQPADITFYNADGSVTHPKDVGFDPVKLTVNREQGISLENSGVVDASAGGNIELVSGEDVATSGPRRPITIDRVTASGGVGGHPTGVIRILGLNGIINGRTDSQPAILGGNLFLEGGNTGAIGSLSAPLVIDLAPSALLEEANAEGSVYLVEKGGNLNLVTAFSRSGTVSLVADGSILNGNTINKLNIKARDIALVAGDDGDSTATIGTHPAAPLYIELAGGAVAAEAPSDISLEAVSGDLVYTKVTSQHGKVYLTAPNGNVINRTLGEPDTLPPISAVSPLPKSQSKLTFPVSVTGTDPASSTGVAGSGISSFDIYVSVDGGKFVFWRNVPASSPTAMYTGQSNHTYAFVSLAHDRAGNVERKRLPLVADRGAVTFVPDLHPPLQITAITVQQGMTERSFVQSIDVSFNLTGQALNDLVSQAATRITLVHFGLNGVGPVIIPLSLASVTAVDHAIEIDFGRYGLGGVARTPQGYWSRMVAGDGYYELDLQLNPDSPAKTPIVFSRLLGDVNGDQTVNRRDVLQVARAIVHPNSGLFGDVNGDGRVNATDLKMVLRSRGRTLAHELPQRYQHLVQLHAAGAGRTSVPRPIPHRSLPPPVRRHR